MRAHYMFFEQPTPVDDHKVFNKWEVLEKINSVNKTK